jgi:hypothetical protein
MKFSPLCLNFACINTNYEPKLAVLPEDLLEKLKDLGLLMISSSQFVGENISEGISLKRKVLWERKDSKKTLELFDSFYTKNGMPIPVLDGALFLLPSNPFAMVQIFHELQRLKYTPKQLDYYKPEANLILESTDYIDARYVCYQIYLVDPDCEDCEGCELCCDEFCLGCKNCSVNETPAKKTKK